MYEKTTHNIRITVAPDFLEDQSRPEDSHYVWSYHVRIENNGEDIVQLRTRYWRITDATGHVHEVQGDGVVGEQPVLHPGESFEYTSGTPLPTPSGIMLGTYSMHNGKGESFNVDIPPFSLDSPHERHMVH